MLAGSLGVLLAVLLARAAASYGGEIAALRAAAAVKSQLRRRLTDHALRLGPSWLARHRSGEVTTLATRGLDGLDAYFARYLPQLVLACVVPFAVLIRVGLADWISGLVIGLTLPLIPVFAILVGLHTKATTQRQWRLLARLGGHFLDVVEGLPTLKLFGRGKRAGRGDRQGHRRVPGRHHVLAARRVPVRLRAGTGGRAGHRAGRGGGRAAPAGRAHELPDRAARAAAHARGLPAAARGRRAVPRQHRGRRRGPGRLRDPRHPGASGSGAWPAHLPPRGPAPGHHQAERQSRSPTRDASTMPCTT